MKEFIEAFPYTDYFSISEIYERGQSIGDIDLPTDAGKYAAALTLFKNDAIDRIKNDDGHWVYKRKLPEGLSIAKLVTYYAADHVGETITTKDVQQALNNKTSTVSGQLTKLEKQGYVKSTSTRGSYIVFDKIHHHPHLGKNGEVPEQLSIVKKPKPEKIEFYKEPELKQIELMPMGTQANDVSNIVQSLVELKQKADRVDNLEKALHQIANILAAVHIID